MTYGAPARMAVRGERPAPLTGLTIYGCGPDEAALFRELSPRCHAIPTITSATVSEENAGLAYGSRCISIGHKARVSHVTLRALARVGVTYISTRSVGYDHLDVGYANSVGIRVGNVGYAPDGVADYTLLLMLMLVRDAMPLLTRAAARDYRSSERPGAELRDLTVGVIGTGRIGLAVIDRLRGFGCRILAHDRHPKTAADYRPLLDVLRQSDIVTLHTPLGAETRHLLDRHRIAQMKRGAFLVNTGRGALVDTEALIVAVERGGLGGAALDVVEGEEGVFYADRTGCPDEGELLRRLHALPTVIVSPHAAYYTKRALRDIVAGSLANCLEFANGGWHG
jgi:D-specific alpha-keto acid dehydrogenase